MSESLISMAKDLALAQIQAGQITPEDMTSTLNSIYQTLQHLSANEQVDALTPLATKPTDWKKSITKHAVTCLECGATFRQLSARHLRLHNLDGRSYRDKYGIPRAQSLSARDVLARRRAIVNASRPWEKSPTNQNAASKAKSATVKKAAKKAASKRQKRA